MVEVEEVVALDERIDRVTPPVGVGQLTDDAGILRVEIVRQTAELKGLRAPEGTVSRGRESGPAVERTIQKDSLSPEVRKNHQHINT